MDALTGIKELDLIILSKLDVYDLLKMYNVNKYLRELIKDDKLWKDKSKEKNRI